MIYVDNARIQARVQNINARWSHLTADTEAELLDFAVGIGLRREWFQTCKKQCSREGEPCPHWHFDVTDGKRAQAVKAGAQEIGLGELGELIRSRRAAHRQAAAADQAPQA